MSDATGWPVSFGVSLVLLGCPVSFGVPRVLWGVPVVRPLQAACFPADSTGTHSLYTTYQDYEIMFHVSTMLPYTPNNRQQVQPPRRALPPPRGLRVLTGPPCRPQLLRKRHIGNDIVTIIFQEPGALPFTPQNVRSHFQHVFIIVRAHQPCTDRVSYRWGRGTSRGAPGRRSWWDARWWPRCRHVRGWTR